MALHPCSECKKEISSDAKTCPHCGKKTGMSTGVGCLSLIIGLLIIGAVVGQLNKIGGNSSQSGTQSPEETALSQIKLDYSWRKGGFDSVMEANFTITNNSQYNVKDVEITCNHFAKSGTKIDSNTRTIYDIVNAHSSKKFPNFNMGFIHSQASSSACSIVSLSIAP